MAIKITNVFVEGGRETSGEDLDEARNDAEFFVGKDPSLVIATLEVARILRHEMARVGLYFHTGVELDSLLDQLGIVIVPKMGTGGSPDEQGESQQ